MNNDHWITDQKINPVILARAKSLRKNMTPAEKILWQQLRAHRLGGLHFRRQQIIKGFIIDFYCHPARLVIELDGPIHDFQIDADQIRDETLSSYGLYTLRFRNDEILNSLPAVLEKIRSVCYKRISARRNIEDNISEDGHEFLCKSMDRSREES